MTAPLGTAGRDSPAGRGPAASALGDAHASLLQGATERAADVTAALDAGRWPRGELGTLVSFLRASLLRQVSDEEVRLFPADPYRTPFAELASEHARCGGLIRELVRVWGDGCEPVRLRALLVTLLATLERHLHGEEELV